MDESTFISLTREAVWTGVLIASPVLAVALLSGLVVGLVQALTSVQELTLTFVPKLVAILVVFWLTISFMGQQLITLFQARVIPFIAGS